MVAARRVSLSSDNSYCHCVIIYIKNKSDILSDSIDFLNSKMRQFLQHFYNCILYLVVLIINLSFKKMVVNSNV